MVKVKPKPAKKKPRGALAEIRYQQKKTENCISKSAIIRYVIVCIVHKHVYVYMNLFDNNPVSKILFIL